MHAEGEVLRTCRNGVSENLTLAPKNVRGLPNLQSY